MFVLHGKPAGTEKRDDSKCLRQFVVLPPRKHSFWHVRNARVSIDKFDAKPVGRKMV